MAVRPTQKKVSAVSGPSQAKFVHGSYPPSASNTQKVKPSSRDYGKQEEQSFNPFGNTSMSGRS
jgi:hypothetical protein